MNELDEYIHKNRMTLREFGERVGVGAATVHKWRRGTITPKYEMRRKISRVTRGQVPISAWGQTL